jgi:pilus assembly protein TadC
MAGTQPDRDLLNTFRRAVERDSRDKSRLAAEVIKREQVAFARIIATTITDLWGASKQFGRDAVLALRDYLRSEEGKRALRNVASGIQFTGNLASAAAGLGRLFPG